MANPGLAPPRAYTQPRSPPLGLSNGSMSSRAGRAASWGVSPVPVEPPAQLCLAATRPRFPRARADVSRAMSYVTCPSRRKTRRFARPRALDPQRPRATVNSLPRRFVASPVENSARSILLDGLPLVSSQWRISLMADAGPSASPCTVPRDVFFTHPTRPAPRAQGTALPTVSASSAGWSLGCARSRAASRTQPLSSLAGVFAEEDALHLAEHLKLEVHHVRC